LEYKNATQLEIKSVDDGTGTFTGYLAVFGDVDSDKDTIVKGAFKVSLASKRLIPILWQHVIVEPIGVWTELKEDDHGLLVTGRLAIDTDAGARAYSLLKMLMESAKQFDARGVFALSIGYKAVQFDRIKGVRHLKEIKLFEGSFVTFSSNSESNVTSVKGIKAMNTFKETLAAHELRKDLSNQRWTVEDAKDDSMDSIMCDPGMDKEAKKKAARKTLHDAADAHADITDQKIDALPEVDEAADLKAADTDTLEVKAAKKSLAGVISMHVEAARKCDQAMYKMHQGQALATKAIAAARMMDYAAINVGGDKTPPQPMGGKSAADLAAEVKAAADKVEHDAFIESLKTARAKLLPNA
jgi:HK97 family phage prohead protease